MHYIDRLNICNLESLEYRRICHDLTFLYKYLHGFVQMQLQDCIVRNVHEHNLRGNVYKLIKFYSRLDIRKQFLLIVLLIIGTIWKTLWCVHVHQHYLS